jgi:Peptidase inhibitor family I36
MKPVEGALRSRVAMAWVLGAIALLAAPVAEAQRWGREDFPHSGACFFRDANFRGDYFCTRADREVSVLPPGMNDQISSIRTFGDVEVRIYQDGGFRGRSTEFRGDVRNLRNEGWNDRLSSLRVSFRHGHGDDHRGYREGGSGDRDDHRDRDDRYSERDDDHHERFHGDADAVVRGAYRDILEREPDAAGLRLYRSRLIDDGWSEKQVRDALHNSPEYREKHNMTPLKAEEIVRRAYRSELGREPDAGSRAYVNRVLRDHWTEQDVIRELRKSPEYRSKHR